MKVFLSFATFVVLIGLLEIVHSKIVISEVLTHTDEPYYDYIELHNNGKSAVDVGGWFVSNKKQNPRLKTIPRKTVIQPGQYITVPFKSPNRLNKKKEKVTLSRLDSTGQMVEVDDAKVPSSLNHMVYQRWENSQGDSDLVVAFPTQNFASRYPIVGPFVISEIRFAHPPTRQQYVRITCIRGTRGQTVQGRASTIARGGGYHLRFDSSNDTSVFDIPTIEMSAGQHIWIVSGNPAAFAQAEGVPADRVYGPWTGVLNDGKKGDKVSLWGYEGHKASYFLVEKVNWKTKAPWPQPDATDEFFAIERVSLNTYANDPLNWKRRGSVIPCNPQNGASDCPWIDNCTIPFCSTAGHCFYNSLACNSPTFASCYPNTICGGPVQERTSKGDYPYGRTLNGCDLPNDAEFSMFGHGAADIDSFGWYETGRMPAFYWSVACRNVQIDCYVNAWGPWQRCQNGAQIRTRTIRLNPLAGGKACPALQETRPCQGATAVDSDATVNAVNSDNQAKEQTVMGLPAVTGTVVIVIVVVVALITLVGVAVIVKTRIGNSKPETP
jgi:hypothetical protein